MEKDLSLVFLLFYLRLKRQYKKYILYTKHKSQNSKFLWLDKTFVLYYFALFMALNTKTANFHDLIRTLFLTVLLLFWLQNQNGKFLWYDKTFVPCSFACFMTIKFEMEVFWDLIKILFFVLLLRLWLQKPKTEFLWLDKTFVSCSCLWF